MLSSSGKTLQPWCKPQESDKNKKSELFSVYVGAVSEEAKEFHLGHAQSNAADHLCQAGGNGQQLGDFHSSKTEKKINKGSIKVFVYFFHSCFYLQAPFLLSAISLDHCQRNLLFW